MASKGLVSGSPNTTDLIELKFPRSDGDPAKRPANIDPTPDKSGSVNYHRFVSLEEAASKIWRHKAAVAVAAHLGKPSPNNYIFDDFPEHYAFYDHNKGSIEGPRHDLYLYGSLVKFRSVNEFVPHAIWLMTDETLNRSNCKCKYCTKSKTQSDISKAHGLSLTPGPSSVIKKEMAEEYSGDFRQSIIPAKRKEAPRQLANHDRVNDLRSARLFRENEVVWCALAPSLPSSRLTTQNIPPLVVQFWPAIIQEPVIKVYTGPSVSSEKYASIQRWSYKVKLLALTQSAVVPEVAVLPYQSYQPPHALISYLNDCPKLSLASLDDMGRMAQVTVSMASVPPRSDQDPFALKHVPKGFASSLEVVASQLTLAIEIAGQVTRLWSLTDQWQFQGIMKDFEGGPDITVSESRFQGIWWGAERIWQEDLVRLKMRRSMLAKPEEGRVLRATPGSEDRAVLMRIASVFHEPTTNSCRISGALYEVADKDWEKRCLDPAVVPISSVSDSPSKNRVDTEVQKFHSPSTPSQIPTPAKSNATDGHRPLDPTPSTSRHIFMSPPLRPLTTTPASSPSRPAGNTISIPPSPSRPVMSPRLQPMEVLEANSEDEVALSYPTPTVAEGNQPGEYRFKLPTPPKGFAFRPILAPEQEVWVDLSFMAGRYYPNLSEAPLLKNFLDPNSGGLKQNGLSSNLPPVISASLPPLHPSPAGPSNSTSVSTNGDHLQIQAQVQYQADLVQAFNTLNALAPGYFNAVEAVTFKQSRFHLIRYADQQARMLLHSAWNKQVSRGVDVPMEPVPEPEPMSEQDADRERNPRTMTAGLLSRQDTLSMVA